MKNILFDSDVQNAIETVETVDTVEHGYNTYYIDLLKSGEYGVSVDEYPLQKFDILEEAQDFIKERL